MREGRLVRGDAVAAADVDRAGAVAAKIPLCLVGGGVAGVGGGPRPAGGQGRGPPVGVDAEVLAVGDVDDSPAPAGGGVEVVPDNDAGSGGHVALLGGYSCPDSS